jgi:hypothetical protein
MPIGGDVSEVDRLPRQPKPTIRVMVAASLVAVPPPVYKPPGVPTIGLSGRYARR